ncbi:uncharacterized protein [Ptychodera flava]|uniref:uncharacterized protein n=1 Tax=Ptychodera flava TaxID=63121 RepID=UPI00396A8AD9
MPSEWSASDIQRLMITIKAINVDCQQSAFNIAVICRASEMGEIMQAFKRDKNFVSVQPVFCHVQTCSSTRRFGLIEAVQCMVVAMYCSQDKNPIQHPTEERHNMWSCDTPQRTYDHVIQTFSHRGGWILHIFSGSGNGMISSLKNGRHCIVADHSSDQLAILCDNVSQFVWF